MPYRKYCMVPKCTSSTALTPNKLFINLPNNPQVREKWCEAAKRNLFGSKKLSPKSTIVICEDHFNLEEDMENYMQYKLMGPNFTTIRLKKGVVPHKFECQTEALLELELQKSLLTVDEQSKLQTSSKIVKPTFLFCHNAPEIYNDGIFKRRQFVGNVCIKYIYK